MTTQVDLVKPLQVLTFLKYSTQRRRRRSLNRSCPPAGDVHEHVCKMYFIYLFILSPLVLLMVNIKLH